jgi:hypothetical protein
VVDLASGLVEYDLVYESLKSIKCQIIVEHQVDIEHNLDVGLVLLTL